MKLLTAGLLLKISPSLALGVSPVIELPSASVLGLPSLGSIATNSIEKELPGVKLYVGVSSILVHTKDQGGLTIPVVSSFKQKFPLESLATTSIQPVVLVAEQVTSCVALNFGVGSISHLG